MSKTSLRVPFVALVMVLFLIVMLGATPSGFSNAGQRVLPNLDEIDLFRQLMAAFDPAQGNERHFQAVEADDLVSALHQEEPSFALFDRAHREAQGETLAAIPYGRAIERAAERFGVDGLLLASVVEVESNFNARAVSPRGAVGLAQVMPSAEGLYTVEALQDPDTNLAAGAWYLKALLDQYDGDLELTLAAYNAGPGNVARYGGVPPFSETRAFIRKVLALYETHHQGTARLALHGGATTAEVAVLAR